MDIRQMGWFNFAIIQYLIEDIILILVSTYLFGKKKPLELSVRWNLGSGLPYTPTAGFYQKENFNNGISNKFATSNSRM
jgi:hypothetical protein